MHRPLETWIQSPAYFKNPKIIFILNLVGFQLGWWMLVLSASYQKETLGLIVMALLVLAHFLFVSQNRARDLYLLKACSVVGILGDSLLIYTGVLKTTDGSVMIPLWLVGLWFLFPLTLPYSFKSFFSKNSALPFLSLGAAASYYAGEAFNVLTMARPLMISLLIISLMWIFYFVIFRWIYKSMELTTHLGSQNKVDNNISQ